MKHSFLYILLLCATVLMAQTPVPVGQGSYASFVPLSESRSDLHGGCQAYQMEHRTLYLPDSLLERLGAPDASRQGTLALPSNDWWTYALIGQWTGKIWSYPGWVEAKNAQIEVGYPTYWEPTGCEMKWDAPLSVSFLGLETDAALVDAWSDYMMSFVMRTDDEHWVRTTCVHGSPLVWIEAEGVMPQVNNTNASLYATFETTVGTRHYLTVGLLTDGLDAEAMRPYAFRIPRDTRIAYEYAREQSTLQTRFHVGYEDIVATSAEGVIQGFLPHHYYNTSLHFALSTSHYATPRGQMRIARGNDFDITYTVHTMLPFFPLPTAELQGYSPERMQQLCRDYAAKGTFGADTYWGGKGLTQMMHYMTAAMQMGDTVTYRLAKQRLRTTLENWYTYTPGESQFFFAHYPRWGALVGFDPSYDSDTFNDHHFHYGYFVYASAVLCMLDQDFRDKFGPMVREVARDYANWQHQTSSIINNQSSITNPWFRTLDPYCGHSFAGGMGNQGNGNGQESSSEAMQGWGGVWMLGAALGDEELLQAGVFGYTLESRATAEYWFDRGRRNIDYTKYKHPWCCNLTMQGVGWWTWFSGDPVWMHSIQWLPISPVLQNYLSEDRDFARWDYTEMYQHKEVGNYEAAQGGLGDESGLGNVCLSYLAIFDPDSAARVWDDMDRRGKALAKNPDTGGITYLFAHGLRQYGHQRHDILSDYPLSAAFDLDGVITYAVFNPTESPLTVHFFGAASQSIDAAPLGLTLRSSLFTLHYPIIADDLTPRPQDPMAEMWTHAYPNVALHKSVTASSYENAGTMAAGLTDGDLTTRWGSQHKDNEWAIVNLGSRHYIDHLVLRWEAAYASEVELSLSDDRSDWHSVVISGTGGVQRVELAQLMMEQGLESRGQYLRIMGRKRATAYGTSLYELEAYGLPLAGDATKVLALEITSTTVSLVPGQTPDYQVHAYNCLGEEMTVSPTIRTTVTDLTYTITATSGSLMATYTWPILEQVQVVSASVTPSEVTVALGESVDLTISTLDQFGYVSASQTERYQATELGDHTITLSLGGLQATALVHVVGYADLNLALGRPTKQSGSEGDGTDASHAVDGKLDTRWSSRFQDEEWMQVDLQDAYLVNRVKLYWEAAYATSFEILVSLDGTSWTSVYSTTNAKGGIQDLPLSETPARYVRILCHRRNTGYGSSLWEVEIYGSGRYQTITDVTSPAADTDANARPEKQLRSGHVHVLTPTGDYLLTGQRQ